MSAKPELPDTEGRDERFLAACGSFSRGAGVFVFLAGALTLVGWFFDIGFLRWASPNRVVMKANAALALALSGISLWLIGRETGVPGRRVAGACALLVALLGLLTLVEYAAGWDLGIDQLLVREKPGALKTSSPGRMAPNAALDFALLGASLFAISLRGGCWPASVMAFVAGAVGLLAMLGHTYADEPSVPLVAHSHIAFQTALALTVLASGVLLAMKDRGLLGPLAGAGAGSVVARRLLPAVLLVPLALEWLRHEGEALGAFEHEFGVALMVVSSMAILTLVVQRGAVVLNRADLERKRAAASLAARERDLAGETKVLETIYSNVQFMVVYLDSRFNFIRVNPAYAEACGHPPDFFPGKNHFDLYPHPENEAIFRRAVATGEPVAVLARPFEYPDHPERGVTYWDWSLQPVKEADGAVSGLIFCLRDVTESVRGDFRLRDSERRLDMAIDGADLGLWDWNVGAGTVVLSEKWGRMLGYSPAEVEPGIASLKRLVHPDDLTRVDASIADHLEGRTPYLEAEFRMRAKTGEWRWVSTRGRVFEWGEDGQPVRATGIFQDTTRSNEMEQTVLQQEKMDVLGQLAAGMAHEIRNPLSGLNIYLAAAETLAVEAEVPDPETRERLLHALGTARSASVRIESVIRRVMDFVKPSPSRPGLMKVNDTVTESVALVATTLRKSGIRLATTLAEGLPRCRADSRLIEQLVLNLVTNAAQAMEAQKGDKAIEIATGAEGNAVFIKVADSGPGVSRKLREKIFEPFFTTKSTGTGLGLSISRRIVAEHGGTLDVGTSRLGGAEFRVVLPAAGESGNEPDGAAPGGTAG